MIDEVKTLYLRIFLATGIFLASIFPFSVHAQCSDVTSGGALQQSVTGQQTQFFGLARNLVTGNVCQSPGEKTVRVLQFILGFVALILVLISLYAGFLWMTAAGDSSKVEKAKEMLKNAVIGLVVLLSAEIITLFIVERLVNIIAGGKTV